MILLPKSRCRNTSMQDMIVFPCCLVVVEALPFYQHLNVSCIPITNNVPLENIFSNFGSSLKKEEEFTMKGFNPSVGKHGRKDGPGWKEEITACRRLHHVASFRPNPDFVLLLMVDRLDSFSHPRPLTLFHSSSIPSLE